MDWYIGSFQEFEFLSAEDRRRLMKRHSCARLTMVLVGRAVFFGTIFGLLIASPILSGQPWAAAVSIPLAAVAVYQSDLSRIRTELRIFLKEAARRESLPMCLGCGYSLSGTCGDLCPECGAVIPQPDPALAATPLALYTPRASAWYYAGRLSGLLLKPFRRGL